MCVHATDSCAQATEARTAPRLRGTKGNQDMTCAAQEMAMFVIMNTDRPRKRARKPPLEDRRRRVARKLAVVGFGFTGSSSGTVLVMVASVSSVGMGSKTMDSGGDSIMRRVGMIRPNVYSIW